jgi:hypothetical protein
MQGSGYRIMQALDTRTSPQRESMSGGTLTSSASQKAVHRSLKPKRKIPTRSPPQQQRQREEFYYVSVLFCLDAWVVYVPVLCPNNLHPHWFSASFHHAIFKFVCRLHRCSSSLQHGLV